VPRAENEALVRRIFAAFAEKRGFALRDAFADDATWTVPGSGTMAGTVRGRDEIFTFLGRVPRETGGTYPSPPVHLPRSDDLATALFRCGGARPTERKGGGDEEDDGDECTGRDHGNNQSSAAGGGVPASVRRRRPRPSRASRARMETVTS